jgi:hypothetical protein
MSLQPWSVVRAPRVAFINNDDQEPAIALRHADTQVIELGRDGCAKGWSLWKGDAEGGPVMVAFDWIEMRQSVPILTDPNAVLSNLEIHRDNAPQSDLRQVVSINVMLARTNWQVEAVAAARKRRQLAG